MHSPKTFEIEDRYFACENCRAKNILISFLNGEHPAGYSIALNAEKIIRMFYDDNFRDLVQKSVLLVYDGVACKLWLHRWGVTTAKDMKKIDLPNEALALANEQSVSVGIFAGHDQNKEALKDRLLEEYSKIRFSFINHGYLSDEEMDKKLRKDQVKFCFLGLGSPRQEEVATKLKEKHINTMFFCVGGAFDIKLGNKKRAPQFIINSNFEWLYRLLQEPRRLPRYAKIMKLFYVILKFPVSVR